MSKPGSHKANPLLAKYEAKAKAEARAEYDIKVEIREEIDMIALMLCAHRQLHVGPGRAPGVLDGYAQAKLEVAQAIVKESSEDEQGEFCVTQRDLAKAMKQILGAQAWQHYKYLFPMLRSYWDLV